MDPVLAIFVAFLFAHLIGDFPLQTGSMVSGKIALRPAAYLWHGFVHLACAVTVLALFIPWTLLLAGIWPALLLLAVGHLFLDLGKALIIRRAPRIDGALLYVADQLLHVAIVALAALVAVSDTTFLASLPALWQTVSQRVLVFCVILAAAVFPAGYLIRYLLTPLSRDLAASRLDDPASRDSLEGLANAGLYLGWLERGLLTIAFALGSFAAVGLIIGAKSVARFPEFKSRAFAEYFLLGTLMSVAVAALGGWVLGMAMRALA